MSDTKPDGSALLVIDVQNDVVADAYERDQVVATIAQLVQQARVVGTPVVWVQHSDDRMVPGSAGWQIVPELQPAPGEAVVHKKFGDSFAGTDLADVLAAAGAARLIVTGAQTDACIRSTLHGALTRGYDVTLVSDAHTTEDMRPWGSPIGPSEAIEYTNLYWSFSKTPDATGSVAAASEVDFRG